MRNAFKWRHARAHLLQVGTYGYDTCSNSGICNHNTVRQRQVSSEVPPDFVCINIIKKTAPQQIWHDCSDLSSSKGFFPFNEKTAAQTWLAAQGMVPGQIERIKLFGNGVRSLFLILQGSVLHHCIIICENQVFKILAANLSWSCKKVSFFLVGNPTGNPNAWCKTFWSFKNENGTSGKTCTVDGSTKAES